MRQLRAACLLFSLLAAANPAGAGEYTLGIGADHGFSGFDDLLPEASYSFSSGDALIATFGGAGSIGAIAGGKNVVVIPEITAFGQTVVPEITADTRSGLRVSTAFDGYAGIELSAGVEIGGGGLDLGFNAGPRLTLPTEIRAGQFFDLRGDMFVSDAHFDLDLGLPSLNAGLDLVMGGSANGKIEYGLFPVAGYKVGEFNFNLPDIRLPVIDLNWDLNLPEFPAFNFLSDPRTAAVRVKLPPNNPALSAGEIAFVSPTDSAVSKTTVEDNAIVTTTTGELLRLGLDLDGLASFAVSGASFTGLEIPVEVNEVKLATLKYDTIDVKYGLELGYEVENRIDTFLEMTLNFLDPDSDPAAPTAKSVLTRSGDSVEMRTSWSGRWDELPSLSLIDASDVLLDIEFTGLKRELTQSATLTLSDYMELSALLLKATIVPGVSATLGPLYYKKLELAGELGAFELFENTITLTDFGLAAGFFDDQVLLEALPANDAYLTGARGRGGPSGTLNPLEFSLLSSHAVASAADAPDMVAAIAENRDREPTRGDFDAVTYRVTDSADRTFAGLYLPEDSRLVLDDGRDEIDFTARLNNIENDGLIDGTPYLSENGSLRLLSVEGDGALTISGNGEIRFGRSGGLAAGILINGAGHTISFDHNTLPDPAARGWMLNGTETIFNDGTIRARFGGVLNPVAEEIDNADTGTIAAYAGSVINLTSELRNKGLILADGEGSTVNVTTRDIYGGFDGGTGTFAADNGGAITFTGEANSPVSGPELELRRSLEFIAGDGATITFNHLVTLVGEKNDFITDPGGTIVLNGLHRDFSDTGIQITNRGLLDVVSGRTTLREPGSLCSGSDCATGSSAKIEPLDLINEGTVRVHAGAEFAFDVNIVDYAEGGATLAGGTWEVLGENTWFTNNSETTGSTAVIDVRVGEVFGNAAMFADLTFDETVDPETGEINITGISDLNTELAVNEANVILSGAARFDYFNTVAVNRGTFELHNQRSFTTAGDYTNDGGTTLVDSGAELRVAGDLTVNGGTVRFAATSGFRADNVEVNGGSLVIAEGTNVDPVLVQAFSAESGPGAGLRLPAGHTWIVRDNVTVGADGSETVTPGLIDLAIRTFPDPENPAGLQGVTDNDATVIIDGAQAEFRGFESRLDRNTGSLTLRGGKVFDTDVPSFTNGTGGTLNLEGAQFLITDGLFSNAGGSVNIDATSYLEADTLRMTSGEMTLAGVVRTNQALFYGGTLAFTDGVLYTASVLTTDDFTVAGGTLYAKEFDGSLVVESGVFAPGQSIADSTVDGDFLLDTGGLLEIEWSSEDADFLAITGTASLAGTLQISLLDGFVPEVGASLEFLTAASILGGFDLIDTIPGASGLAFAVRADGGSLFIDVTAVPLPGAVWLLLSGFGFLVAGRTRKRAP